MCFVMADVVPRPSSVVDRSFLNNVIRRRMRVSIENTFHCQMAHGAITHSRPSVVPLHLSPNCPKIIGILLRATFRNFLQKGVTMKNGELPMP
jgi:hypothetical protein